MVARCGHGDGRPERPLGKVVEVDCEHRSAGGGAAKLVTPDRSVEMSLVDVEQCRN